MTDKEREAICQTIERERLHEIREDRAADRKRRKRLDALYAKMPMVVSGLH